MNSGQCYFSEWNRYLLCNADSEVLKNTFNVDVSKKLTASSISAQCYFRKWKYYI